MLKPSKHPTELEHSFSHNLYKKPAEGLALQCSSCECDQLHAGSGSSTSSAGDGWVTFKQDLACDEFRMDVLEQRYMQL